MVEPPSPLCLEELGLHDCYEPLVRIADPSIDDDGVGTHLPAAENEAVALVHLQRDVNGHVLMRVDEPAVIAAD
jgi:hypothetical protein